MSENGLPESVLGRDEAGQPVTILPEHRPRGLCIVGAPGSGKTNLIGNLALADIAAGTCGTLVLDHHNLARLVLGRIPEHRRADVVVVSLLPQHVPMLPILDVARSSEEMNLAARFLVDSWRAHWGDDAVGPRSESILVDALLIAGVGAAPVEVAAVLALRGYRHVTLRHAEVDQHRTGFARYLTHEGVVASVGERVYQEWAQSTFNKLRVLLDHEWLRRATSSMPPCPELVQEWGRFSDLLEPDVVEVTLVRDGVVMCRREGEVDPSGDLRPIFIRVGHELDDYLTTWAGDGRVCAPAFAEGVPVSNVAQECVDLDDPTLAEPRAAELDEFGPGLAAHVACRRRRRGWWRLCRHVLEGRASPPRIREAVDIADLLDERKVVVVEAPQQYGTDVSQILIASVLIGTLMRGHRQMSLPIGRVVPTSVYCDEAALVMGRTFERTFAELRKARVSLTIGVQHLGQLRAVSDRLRDGIIRTVGGLCVLAPGLEEDRDEAALLGLEAEALRRLGTGEGYASLLGEHNRRQSPRSVRFLPLAPETEGAAAEIRTVSLARHYMSPVEADAHYALRAARIEYAGVERSVEAPKAKRQSAAQNGRPQLPLPLGPQP